uniref:Histidine kinase/HSP90-like ATPase domain-containing protein n=1 Tax=viral metagenome TaxID=1070528 RepID=A0A6C0KTW0_9ZZZZ
MSISMKAGSRNEAGFVNNLDRKGFTQNKGLSEIVANASDAGASYVMFQISGNVIKIWDDGKGMTLEKIQHMYDSERENHTTEETMGVSGVGGLISLYILSKDDDGAARPSMTYTKSEHGPYLMSIAPWDVIKQEVRYDGMVDIESMTEEQMATFHKETVEKFKISGTTHAIPYSDGLAAILIEQFQDKPNTEIIPYESRLSVIFGKTPIDLFLDKGDGTPVLKLKKYDYMSGKNNEYYVGKNEERIHFIQDENGIQQSLWYDDVAESWMAFHNRKKTTERDISPTPFLPTYKTIGILTITTAMRIDPQIFDPLNPVLLDSASLTLNAYDSIFFDSAHGHGEKLKSFFGKTVLNRNTQRITGWSLKGDSTGVSRGGAKSLLEMVHLRCELSYHTYSAQNNKMDEILGIQQNKNQHQNVFPLHLERMIGYLRSRHFEKIRMYFKGVVDAKNSPKRVLPPIASVPVLSESESDSEQSDVSEEVQEEPSEVQEEEPKEVPFEQPQTISIQNETSVNLKSGALLHSEERPRDHYSPRLTQSIEESRRDYLDAAARLKAFAEDPNFVTMGGNTLLDFIIQYIEKSDGRYSGHY